MITVLDLYNYANAFHPREAPRALYVLYKGRYEGVDSKYKGWSIYSIINREDLEIQEADFWLVDTANEVIYPIAEEYSIHWELLDIVYPTRDKDKILRRLNTISKWKEEYYGDLPL